MKMGEKTSLHTAIEVTKAMRDRPSYIELVKNIEIPILYVIGKEDTSIPFEISEQQMYLPKKSIVSILENVGHIGMLEAEEVVMLAIKKLLKEIIA